MTPNAKDKAEELLNKFLNPRMVVNIYCAKECALICVDEIIKETKLHDLTIFHHSRTGYWQEVKSEIEKL